MQLMYVRLLGIHVTTILHAALAQQLHSGIQCTCLPYIAAVTWHDREAYQYSNTIVLEIFASIFEISYNFGHFLNNAIFKNDSQLGL